MPARRTFGNTWWGQAWVEALEGRAVYDPNRLPRGRTYARQDRASDLTIHSGRVDARIQGSRPEPYDVVLQLRELRADEWDCVLGAITAKAAHAAALLDGELDPGIVADAQAVDVELLPRSGELRTACSCPDWAEPCKHAAAICYLVADALDADPFVLLLLRGLDRDEVLSAVRARRAAAAPATAEPEAPEPEGMPAREAWTRELAPLPSVPAPPPGGPRRPAAYPSDPPRSAPFDAPGLQILAADAARRAWAMRTAADPSHLDLDAPTDLARRAASTTELERRAMAFRAGVTPAALEAQAAAWTHGGADGVAMLEAPPWPAAYSDMAAARAVLVDNGLNERTMQVRANRVTIAGRTQFRRSYDGRWYLFAKRSGRWVLAAPAADEIDDLLDAI